MKPLLPLPLPLLLLATYLVAPQSLNPIWPPGTKVIGSSTHATVFDSAGKATDYFPLYALDGDNNTFWNDDSPNIWPDTLIIQLPRSMTMSGMTLVSATQGGYIVDWTADILDGTNWVTVADVTGATDRVNVVSFAAVKPTTQLRITVNKGGTSTPNGDFSRINEVIPVFVDRGTTATSTPAASSSSSSSSSSKTSSTNVGAIAGGVVGGVLFIALLAGLAYFLRTRHRRKKTPGHSRAELIPEYHATAYFHSGRPEYKAELSSEHQSNRCIQPGGHNRGVDAAVGYPSSPPLHGAGAYEGVPIHPQSPRGVYEIGKTC